MAGAAAARGTRQPGLPREQRRVQSALLHATDRQLADARRAQQAVEAGWEPVQPANDWLWGYIEDPRLLRGRTLLPAAAFALALAASAGMGLVLARQVEPLAAGATALILAVAAFVACQQQLAALAHRHDRRLIPGQTDGSATIHIFNSVLPPAAVTAYRRAQQSRMFDTFVVYSPRPEDFRLVQATEAPSLGLLDPLLVGRIGEHSFLIAQWDLAKDFAN